MPAARSRRALPDALFDTPLHPYTRGLLTASPRLNSDYHYSDGPLLEFPGSIVSAAGENGCPFPAALRRGPAELRPGRAGDADPAPRAPGSPARSPPFPWGAQHVAALSL